MNILTRSNSGNPEYPLFHCFVCLVFYVPYLLWLFLAGGISHPHGEYPFGFADPVTTLRVLLLLARLASVVMGAGTAVVAFFTARRLWGRTAGNIADVLTSFEKTTRVAIRIPAHNELQAGATRSVYTQSVRGESPGQRGATQTSAVHMECKD